MYYWSYGLLIICKNDIIYPSQGLKLFLYIYIMIFILKVFLTIFEMAIKAPSPLKKEWKTLTAKLIVSVLFLFSNLSNFPQSDIALRKKKNHPSEHSESWRGDSIFSLIDSDSCTLKKGCVLFRFSFLGLWVVKEHCADWARDAVAQNWSNSPGQILQDVRRLCKVMSMLLQQLQISNSMALCARRSLTYLLVNNLSFGFL